MDNNTRNIIADNILVYNKGCVVLGSIFIFVIMWLSLFLNFFSRIFSIELSMLIVIPLVLSWYTTLIIGLHILALIKSKGFLRFFYLVFLWFFQSYLIGLCVWGNISKDPYVRYSYIAIFSCIVLASYCIFFSPLLFLKLHINPRSNIFFRMLDDLNRNFDKAQDKKRNEEVEVDDLIGTIGLSETILRPAGRGRFNGCSIHIITQGEFISANIPIRIIQKSGGLYLVEEYAEGSNEQCGQDTT